jgi:hypothetical protein
MSRTQPLHDHDDASGVRLTRRSALRSALALPAWMALATLVAPGRAAVRPAEDDVGRDDEVAAFLETWQKRVTADVEAGATDDDALLHDLLTDVARLDLATFPPRTKDAFSNGEFTSGPIHGSPTFLVLEFELEPGAPITAHNHVGWSFVSVGVEGEATVRHYEPVGESPDPGSEHDVPFDLREVQRVVLTRGRSSSLTRTRANIHQFRAGPEGARFIDFGVNYATPNGGYTSFSKLAIDEAPTDIARGIHTARWIGNPG